MEEGLQPRILIVDNDPEVGRQLCALLEPLGYRVQIAQGAGEELMHHASTVAAEFRPHVAIIDLRLLDEYRDERSGLKMLEKLPSARRILYSAYLQNEVIREVLRKYAACNVIGKDEPPQRLLEAIEEAVPEVCAQRSGVAIDAPEVLANEGLIASLLGEGAKAPPALVEDVLVQLFPHRKSIRLKSLGNSPVTSEPVTRGKTAVWKAWWDDRLEPLVVKLAPAGRIAAEGQNYHTYIEGNLRGAYHPRLEGDPVTFWDLGGVLYSFIGLAWRDLPSFASFYQQQTDPEKILQPLRHFFGDVWGALYREQTGLQEPLYDAYGGWLHLDELLAGRPAGEPEWSTPAIAARLPDPSGWAVRHREDSRFPTARRAKTHGDLHGDNLFVDGEHAWVIDFERSGQGPALRDFVELEVDILTRLAQFPAAPEAGFADLCLALAAPDDPNQPLRLPEALARNGEFRKAAGVIWRLRRLALELAGFSDLREYYWGLLLDALFLVAAPSKSTLQQARSKLYGAVLCSRLEHWGAFWPLQGSIKDFGSIVQ